MNEWIRINERKDENKDEWMNDEQIKGWMNRRMNELKEEWKDERMNVSLNIDW